MAETQANASSNTSSASPVTSPQGAGSMFRQSALSTISSADDLDKYLKITNPSAWVVLFAAILLIGGLIFWSATAVIPTDIDVTGIASEGSVICWVDKDVAQKMRNGSAKISINGDEATNVVVSDIPLSAAEIRRDLESEFVSDSLQLSEWNYDVTFEVNNSVTEKTEGHLVPVDIVVAESHPLDLVFGQQ